MDLRGTIVHEVGLPAVSPDFGCKKFDEALILLVVGGSASHEDRPLQAVADGTEDRDSFPIGLEVVVQRAVPVGPRAPSPSLNVECSFVHVAHSCSAADEVGQYSGVADALLVEQRAVDLGVPVPELGSLEGHEVCLIELLQLGSASL